MMNSTDGESDRMAGSQEKSTPAFTRWRLGSVASLFARVSNEIAGALRFPRFVEVTFGSNEEMIAWTGRDPTPITFQSPKEMRELRSRCRAAAVSGVPLVRAQSAAEPGTVRLDFMFPAAAGTLEYDVPLLLDAEVLRKIEGTADTQARGTLLREIVVETRGGRFLIRHAPDFLGVGEPADIVEFAHPSGWWLLCRLVATPSGRLLLHATDAREPRKDRTFEERRVHFLRLHSRVVEVPSLAEIPENDLEKLRLSSSPLLKRWAVYRETLTAERRRKFQQRLPHTLVYQFPQSAGNMFHVRVANWSGAAVAWCDEPEPPRKRRDLNAAVVIARDEASLAEGRRGTLVSVTPEGDAVLKMEDDWVPWDQACIAARDDGDLNERRQREAIQRLQNGNVALPTLLDILNDPASAAPAIRRAIKTHRGTLNDSQLTAITSALGNESIVAVQGPPGTGKTQVIVDIIKRLWRGRKGDEPLRVLVSSTQNKAVENATDKLMSEGLIIHTILSKKASQQAAIEGRAREHLDAAEAIRDRVSVRLNESAELQKQRFFGDAIVEARRKFTGWPEHLDDAVARMRELLADDAVPAGAAEALRSLRGDGLRLLARADELNAAQTSGEKNRSLGESLARLRLFSEAGVATFDAAGFKEALRGQESTLHANGLVQWCENALELAKGVQRAHRDDDEGAAAAHLIALRQQLDNAASRPRDAGDVHGVARRELGADIAVWLSRCVACLEAAEGDFALSRAGVLSAWTRALKEEPGLWDELRARYAQVTGATCQMAAPDSREQLLEYYDYVIVDEAARSDLGDLLIPLTLGRRILLVGDQKQLPPFIDDNVARKLEADDPDAAVLLRERTLFDDLFDRLPDTNRIMLNVQYRCHPHIGDAISRAFYDGELHSGSELREGIAYEQWIEKKIPQWGLFENRPLVWVDSGPRSAQVRSAANPIETEFAMKLVLQAIAAQGTKPARPFLGLIAFYSGQVTGLKQALASAIPDYDDWLEIGTVDSFQGKEYPLVILCCSNHDRHGRVGFLGLPNRVNVALSRPQRQLIIIGSRSTLLHKENGSLPFKEFASAAGGNLFDGTKSFDA